MNRRDFIKSLGLGAGAALVTVPVVAEISHVFEVDLWTCLRINGFEWKPRHPGMVDRHGNQLGEYFIKHPLIGRVRPEEWLTPGEKGIHKDSWKDRTTWFYYNTGQLIEWHSKSYGYQQRYTLYLPYKKFPVSDINFDTPAEFQKKWDDIKWTLIKT